MDLPHFGPEGVRMEGREKAMISVKIMITGIVSIIVQYGLAIAGWGGWSAFFAHPALRALAWISIVLAIVSEILRQQRPEQR